MRVPRRLQQNLMERNQEVDQRGGAREEVSEVDKTRWREASVRRSRATAVDTAINGTAAGSVTVGLIWQAQAQSAECVTCEWV